MGKLPKAPAVSEACLLSVGLVQLLTRHGVEFTVEVERPGRDGQFSRTWSNARGVLMSDQAEDLAAYVQRTVMDALLLWHGVAEVPAE